MFKSALKSLFAKPAAPERGTILALIPVRNQLVEELTTLDGKLRLSAPLHKTLVHRVFGSGARQKSFELDELGAQIWQACDGRRNVEQVITAFAEHQRVNLREAEVSVSAFLAMLIKRNLLALVTAREAREGRQARVHENRAQRRARRRKDPS